MHAAKQRKPVGRSRVNDAEFQSYRDGKEYSLMKRPFQTVTAMVALTLGTFGLAGGALAETEVAFTVAEWNSRTGPHFQDMATAFEA